MFSIVCYTAINIEVRTVCHQKCSFQLICAFSEEAYPNLLVWQAYVRIGALLFTRLPSGGGRPGTSCHLRFDLVGRWAADVRAGASVFQQIVDVTDA